MVGIIIYRIWRNNTSEDVEDIFDQVETAAPPWNWVILFKSHEQISPSHVR